MNIIGIAGRARAGKSTAASVLVKEFGFVEVCLADPLKRICKEVFAFTDEQLWGPSEYRNAPDMRYPRHNGDLSTTSKVLAQWPLYLTPRYALQTLGTEWGRKCYRDVWVDLAIRTATFLLSGEEKSCSPPLIPTYHREDGASWRSVREDERGRRQWAEGYGVDRVHAKGVCISDVRFPNEVAAIKRAGGVIWKIERPLAGLEGAAGAHSSEAGIDIGCVDHVLSNSGSLEEFHSMVAGVMGFMLKDGRTITTYVPPEVENG
jgi:hypothetical protein